MGWIDEEVVTRVRVSADIVQVANHLGVPVTREGKQFWKVPCPMPGHDDWAGDGGSCLLKPQAQGNNSFFCFGCREKGTVFDFYCHVKGWDPDNADDFQRAVVALHDLFGLNLDVAGCTGVQGRAVRETLAERVVSLPLTAPLVEVDGGEYWRVGGPGLLRYLSPAERACFYNLRSFADDTVYPLTLTNIPAMGIMSLNERSGRLCGVFTRRARDRLFARQHGPAVRMCGPALSGQPVGPAVPRSFLRGWLSRTRSTTWSWREPDGRWCGVSGTAAIRGLLCPRTVFIVGWRCILGIGRRVCGGFLLLSPMTSCGCRGFTTLTVWSPWCGFPLSVLTVFWRLF